MLAPESDFTSLFCFGILEGLWNVEYNYEEIGGPQTV